LQITSTVELTFKSLMKQSAYFHNMTVGHTVIYMVPVQQPFLLQLVFWPLPSTEIPFSSGCNDHEFYVLSTKY